MKWWGITVLEIWWVKCLLVYTLCRLICVLTEFLSCYTSLSVFYLVAASSVNCSVQLSVLSVLRWSRKQNYKFSNGKTYFQLVRRFYQSQIIPTNTRTKQKGYVQYTGSACCSPLVSKCFPGTERMESVI